MEIDHLAGLVTNDSLYGPTVLIERRYRFYHSFLNNRHCNILMVLLGLLFFPNPPFGLRWRSSNQSTLSLWANQLSTGPLDGLLVLAVMQAVGMCVSFPALFNLSSLWNADTLKCCSSTVDHSGYSPERNIERRQHGPTLDTCLRRALADPQTALGCIYTAGLNAQIRYFDHI